MSRQQKVLNTAAVHHTGTVWSALFEKPGKKFLRDFSWVSFATGNPQISLPLSAFMLLVHKNGNLEMRCNDDGSPPADDDAGITVSIRSPNSV